MAAPDEAWLSKDLKVELAYQAGQGRGSSEQGVARKGFGRAAREAFCTMLRPARTKQAAPCQLSSQPTCGWALQGEAAGLVVVGISRQLLPIHPDSHQLHICRRAEGGTGAGTGGMEAALFAADLFNMYQRVAVLNGWKVEIINQNLIINFD